MGSSTIVRQCAASGDCPSPVVARGLCYNHWRRLRRTGTTELRPQPVVEERFWAKVNKDGPVPEHAPELGPCWQWIAGKFSDGYGAFSVSHTEQRKAHRIAWEWENGPIPDGLVPDHQCHDPKTCFLGDDCPHRACVNPGHIKLATPVANTLRRTYHPRPPRTHCGNGHLLDEGNLRWWRGQWFCRECVRNTGRRRKERERLNAAPSRCGAPTKSGRPCTRWAGINPSGYCSHHERMAA